MNNEKGTLTLLLADPHTEVATNKVMEIINKLKSNGTPTLLYEYISEQYYTHLKLNTEQLKKSKVYWKSSNYIEDICFKAKENKKLYELQVIVIDGLDQIMTRERYCLGRADIISIIIQQLKQLAQELNISIIATAPTLPKTISDDFKNDKSKVLSYFCKPEIAQEYIDEIILLNKESN